MTFEREYFTMPSTLPLLFPLAVNWPPFRPDSRPNAGGLGISSSTGLWLTTIDGLN